MVVKRTWLKVCLVTGAVLAGMVGAGQAQSATTLKSPAPSAPTRSGIAPIDPMGDAGVPSLPPRLVEQMAQARNDERQKKLQADTTQLLALATKLKEDVDKTDKFTLSLDVVKRSAEIEKLAKSIRERMKE